MLHRLALASLFLPAVFLPTRTIPSASARRAVDHASSSAMAAPSTFKIDASHSELTFQIRHMVSRVRGTFKDWNGMVIADPTNWSSGSVDVTIQTASITTNNDRRDADLRSGNFFDAEKNPTITFKSTKVEQSGDNVKITGDLTMRGVTKPVVLEGKVIGVTKDAKGKARVGFEASTTINRTEYGVTWNRAVEAGGMLLGDDVKIEIVIAAVEQ